MPTATDLVTDLLADFEVFGQAVATSMADLLGGSSGYILSKASATDMDFTWIANDQGDITGITAGNGISVTSPTGPVPTVAIDTSITVDKTTAQTLTNKTLTSPALTTPTISTLTTNGDLLYGTGSGALQRLGIGSTSNVLTVTGGVPVWAAPAGGGKVLQVIYANYGSAVSSTSGTYATTNVTASITPSAVTSKVIIISTLCLANAPGTTGNAGVSLRLIRGASTVINVMGGSNLSDQLSGVKYGQAGCTYYDSPATTSATTYTIQFARQTAGTVYINGDGSSTDNSTIILMEIGA